MSNDELQAQFPVGSKVWLRSCPHGAAGVVIGYGRGRVKARFHDVDFTVHVGPDRLVLADINVVQNVTK